MNASGEKGLMRIAVIGAGAMGSVIGGLLAKAGNDVIPGRCLAGDRARHQ